MPIDIGFIAFFVYGFWQGYTRGIISTVFNLALYVFGFVLAFKMAPTMTKLLQSMFHSDNPTIFLGAFFVNLLIIMILVRQTARAIEGALRMAYLGIINQVAGGVAMGWFLVVVYSVLVWFGVKVHFINELTRQDSRTYPFLEPLPGKAKEFAIGMKPMALDVWDSWDKWTDDLNEYGFERSEGKDKKYLPPEDTKAIEDDPAPSTRQPAPNRPSAPVLEDSDGIEE
ncbi:MAG: CvpA family protein [Saprospiraceae bacterium]|nr:CvpA family protein [Saprospiraceae bacterium]